MGALYGRVLEPDRMPDVSVLRFPRSRTYFIASDASGCDCKCLRLVLLSNLLMPLTHSLEPSGIEDEERETPAIVKVLKQCQIPFNTPNDMFGLYGTA